jgi:hypothetical protein
MAKKLSQREQVCRKHLESLVAALIRQAGNYGEEAFTLGVWSTLEDAKKYLELTKGESVPQSVE